MKKSKKIISSLLIVSMMIMLFGGCTKKDTPTNTPTESKTDTKTETKDSSKSDEKELIEYTVFHSEQKIESWLDNENDSVTPLIEEKFNIKIKEIIMRGESTEKFNTLVAANAVPDIVIMAPNRLPDIVGMGVLKDLTDYIPKYMPNYWNNLVTERDKPYHYQNGKIYNVFQYNSMYKNDFFADPYFNGTAHAVLTREDLLDAAGYSYTPLAEIQAICDDEGRSPTYEELQVNPPITSPEDLYTYMKKIQDLGLTVNDLEMIPLSIRWSVFHFGTMYNFGHWQWNAEKKQAEGFLGIDGAKEYFEYLNRLYQEGILDKDFLIQKSDQLQQKVASGRVGVFFTDAGGINDIDNKLKATNPDYQLRPLLFPSNDKHGVFDAYSPGWWNFSLNKDLSEEATQRILEVWDYMTTEDALDLVFWGPEDKGYFKVVDGKRRYTDSAWEEAMLSKTAPIDGPQDFGLQNYEKGRSWSRIGNVSPVPGLYYEYRNQPEKSLPPQVSALAKATQYTLVKQVGKDASSSYGNGDLVAKTSKFFWGEFRKNYLAKLVLAETQADFDAAWDETMADFKRITKYDDAVVHMTDWFTKMGNK